jgi:adenosylmethionine-8-amino-7-oxononanoate aminotransferase
MSASSETGLSAAELQQKARDHLWLHFTRMAGYQSTEVPIIVRGDGCYLEDTNGKRYLDALAGLFAVNIGYGYGEEVGEAAAAQLRELPFYTNWSYAHPRAIELAAEVASLAPGDLNRVFFVSGGSEAVESVWKLARQYHSARGERRWKAVARRVAYHGTTMGALSINGIAALKTPFEPLVPGTAHVRNTNRYHRPPEETEEEFTAFLLDDMECAIEQEDPETVALVILEPVQNAGGAFTPPAGYFAGVREICDRYGILLCADEVITGFGRLGHWFGSERYDIRPDLVTSAKGLSSAYASIGAVIARDAVMEPFLEGNQSFTHGITFGGHPVQCAIALKNIEIMKRERIIEHVRENEDAFRSTLAQLLELPIVGDLRGAGYFYALELVKDKETRTGFSDEESESLLRGFLSARLFERGLICRADDRGDPVVQISPPLVAGQAEFDEMTGILGDVLAEAGDKVHKSPARESQPTRLRSDLSYRGTPRSATKLQTGRRRKRERPRRRGRVVRQRPAKPRTPVRFWSAPLLPNAPHRAPATSEL